MSESEEKVTRSPAEIMGDGRGPYFRSPTNRVTVKLLADVLDEDRQTVQAAVEELKNEYDAREGRTADPRDRRRMATLDPNTVS
jgi:hypothetical protein